VNPTEAAKRILIGRKLASHQLHSSPAAVDRLQREDPLAWRRIGTGLSQSDLDHVEKGS